MSLFFNLEGGEKHTNLISLVSSSNPKPPSPSVSQETNFFHTISSINICCVEEEAKMLFHKQMIEYSHRPWHYIA